MTNTMRRFVRNLIALWLGYFIRTLAYLGISLVLARTLGASGYGEMGIFLAVSLGVAQIAGTWPFLSVPLNYARGFTLDQAFRVAGRVTLVVAVGALIVAVVGVWVLADKFNISEWALAVYSLSLVGMQGVYAVFQAVERMNGIAVTQSLERGVGLLLLCGATLAVGLSVRSAQVILGISAALTLVASLMYLRQRFGVLTTSSANAERMSVGNLLRLVGPMGIVSFCAYGIAWVDVLILSLFESAKVIGSYTLAYQIFTAVMMVGSLWVVAALPRHAKRNSAENRQWTKTTMEAVHSLSAVWSGALLGGAALSAVLLPLIFGREFSDSAQPLGILLAGAMFVLGYYMVIPALISTGNTRFLAGVSILGLAGNISLDFVLIPSIGPIGASVATTLVLIITCSLVVGRTYNIRTLTAWMMGTMPPAILTIIVVSVKGHLGVSVFVGILGFVLMVIGGIRLVRVNRRLTTQLPGGQA